MALRRSVLWYIWYVDVLRVFLDQMKLCLLLYKAGGKTDTQYRLEPIHRIDVFVLHDAKCERTMIMMPTYRGGHQRNYHPSPIPGSSLGKTDSRGVISVAPVAADSAVAAVTISVWEG